MSGFIAALLKQRKEAKKAEPKSNGRLKEIINIVNKYNYDNGFTPEIIVNILQDLGPTFVKLGQIASQQTAYMPTEFSEALAKLRSNVAPMDLETVNRITEYAIRALIIVALIIGSTLLCTTTPISDDKMIGAIVFRGVGIVGYIVSLFFAQRLYRNKRKHK